MNHNSHYDNWVDEYFRLVQSYFSISFGLVTQTFPLKEGIEIIIIYDKKLNEK